MRSKNSYMQLPWLAEFLRSAYLACTRVETPIPFRGMYWPDKRDPSTIIGKAAVKCEPWSMASRESVEMFRKDGLILPNLPWDHVLNTGQNQVAGKPGGWEGLGAKFQQKE